MKTDKLNLQFRVSSTQLAFFFGFLLLSVSTIICAQSKNKRPLMYMSFTVDEDWIIIPGPGSDRNYTGGLQAGWFYGFCTVERFISKSLLRLKNETSDLSFVTLNSKIYTPENIRIAQIVPENRPYAGVLYISRGRISCNREKKEKITAELYAGVIGPLSLGKEIQVGYHRLINDHLPMGWHNQIKNDLILNYRINFDKGLISSFNKGVEIIGVAETNAGFYLNNINAGFLLRTGLYNNYFSAGGAGKSKDWDAYPAKAKKAQFYFYARPVFTICITNAVLTGGLFSQNSPHTISGDSLTKINYQLEGGLVLSVFNFSVSYSEKMWGAEFKGGRKHRIGSILLSWPFNQKRNKKS